MKSQRSQLLLFIFILITGFVNAQDTVWVNGVPKVYNNDKNDILYEGASPLVKDDYMFDLSYGYPFVPLREAAQFGINLFSNTNQKGTSHNLNHICMRGEYMINRDFSVGLEMTYASQRFEYYRTYTVTNNNIPVTFDSLFKARVSKFRFLAKMSYHMNISERFDAFGTAGFGYKQFTYSVNDSYLSTSDLANSILPVAIRLSVGGRFFLNEDVAIHVEGGIGGPMMQIGLTYKMHSYQYEKKPANKGKTGKKVKR